MEYAAHPANALDAVITKDEAVKIIDWMEKSGFLARGVTAFKQPPGGPCYVMATKGGGAQAMETMKWGQETLDRFGELKAFVNADAGKQIDTLIAALKDVLPADDAKAEPAAQFDQLVLEDVQGLWGGQDLWISGDGTGWCRIVREPKPGEKGLMEMVYKVKLPPEETAALAKTVRAGDLWFIRLKEIGRASCRVKVYI